ncbi:MAG: metallophosphoesterase family protein, partial [Clostridia bacterium]|nr:metallophosphoesterase family protein [Clostridia bacterium]
LIDNINARMTRADTLYILGDFSYRSRRPVTEYFEAIKPKKVLIVGNHDESWLKKLTKEEKAHLFREEGQAYGFKRYGVELHMSHFPALAWSRSHYFAESLSVCGHIHKQTDETVAAKLFPLVKCQFNAGVDINGYMPVTLWELYENNKRFYQREYTPEEQEKLESAIRKLML